MPPLAGSASIDPRSGRSADVMGSVPEMTSDRLRVDVDRSDDRATMALVGELDTTTADRLRSEVTSLFDAGATRIDVDAAGLEFVDSSGLGALVTLHHEAEERSVALTFRGVPPQVRRLMSITKIDDLLHLAD